MPISSRALVPVVALASLALCACNGHKRLDTSSLPEVERLAIVARVAHGLTVAPGAAQPSGQPADVVAAELAKQVTAFELEERVRTSLVGKLPASPPWSTAMPAVEVATALEVLLVDDRSGPPDYRPLAARGCNSVLEIVVESLSLKQTAGKTGLAMEGSARLFMLDGSTLWRYPFAIDDSADPRAEALDLEAARKGAYRDALIDIVDRLGERLAGDLAGEQG